MSGDFDDASYEAHVEDAVADWAEAHGWEVRKTIYVGRRGCPDRHFYGHGQIIVMEFKRLNGDLSGNQRKERRRLEAVGVKVHVIEDAEVGISVLRAAMRR